MKITRISQIASLTAILIAATSSSVKAAITYTMQEIGSDVVVTSTGSITNPILGGNLPDGPPITVAVNSVIIPAVGIFAMGSDPIGAAVYTNPFITIPAPLGTGIAPKSPLLSVGPVLGIFPTQANSGLSLIVDGDDLFGGSLGAGSGATFTGETLASLGVTPGTYIWVLDSRFNNDTITVNIIPEPSTTLLTGLAAIGLISRRRRAH